MDLENIENIETALIPLGTGSVDAARQRSVYFDRVAKVHIATGSVYSVFSGSFGFYPDAVLKLARRDGQSDARTKNDHRRLVLNDIRCSQMLSRCTNIARMLHYDASPEDLVVVGEGYQLNLVQYLEDVGDGSLTAIDEPRIFRQLFQAVAYLRECKMIHRNIRLKHIYIDSLSSK